MGLHDFCETSNSEVLKKKDNAMWVSKTLTFDS